MFGYKLVKTSDIEELNSQFNTYQSHIFDNAVFVDSQGNIKEGEYDTEEVAELWSKYHKGTTLIYDILRRVRK